MCGSYIPEFLEKLSLHPLALLPLFLSLAFVYSWLHKYNHTKITPPSPPKLPILGNLHQLGKAPHRSLQSLSQKYGELMLLQLGSRPTLVVSSASAAKEIMKTHDVIFSNRPTLKMARKLLYNGKDIASAKYGEYWRKMKSICVLHLLSNSRVRSFRTIREEETALMVENITGLGTNEAVNLSELIITLTNDVVFRAASGRKCKGKDGRNFNKLLPKLSELLGTLSVGDLMPWMGWVDKLNGLEGEADKVAKEFDMFLEGLLEEHLVGRTPQGNVDNDDGSKKVKDFVDILIDVLKDDHTTGLPSDRESIKAVILDIFAGGTDTISTAIEWGMSELLRHPRAMNKLQEEVRSITQGKAIANEDDLEKMEYLKAVIKETLRLYPPGPLLVFRESTRDVKINGYDIAARTQVITNAWAIHRDPSVWKEPDEFYPERFLTCLVDYQGHDFQLIPFGAGRRICPGVQFATTSAELVLANLVNAFDWALPGGAEVETLGMEEIFGITIHRRTPLLLVATPHCN